MSDKPNISLVQQYMDGLHMEAKRGLSPGDLLQIALTHLLETLPNSRRAAIYRVETVNLRLWAFQGDNMPKRALPLKDVPLHQEVLRLQQVRQIEHTLLIPLSNVTGSALLIIDFTSQDTPEDTKSLFLIGHYIGLLIESRVPATTTSRPDSPSQALISSTQFLHRFTEQLRSIDDEQQLVDAASKTLVDATGVSHAGITLVNPDGRFATVASEYPPQDSVGSQIDMQAGIGTKLKEDKQSILIRDVNEPNVLGPASSNVMQQLGIKSALIVPLLNDKHEVLGTIGYDILVEHHFEFTPEVVQIAEILATHLSQNIQRIRLMKLSTKQTQQLEAITQFSQSVIATHDLTTILQSTLETGKELISLDHLGIILFHPRSNDLRLNAVYDGDLTLVDLESAPVIELKNTIAGYVWHEKQAIRINDISNEGNLKSVLSNDLKCFIAVPILELDQLRGVMLAGANEAFAFRDNDYVAFQQLTNQVSVALQNARILAGSERQVQYKAFANQIAAKLQQQMELESLLNTAALELGQVLGARHARIRFNPKSISAQPNE